MADQRLSMPPRPGQRFALLGAHGGAGTTSVQQMLDPQGIGVAYELPQGQHLHQGFTPVIVARSTAYGLWRVGSLLQAWHPHVPRPYLVVVRDAPLRPPTAVRFRTRAVSGRTLGTLHVPYLYQLRSADRVADVLHLRPVAKAARQLRADLGIESKRG